MQGMIKDRSNLEHRETVHPGDETGKCRLAGTRHANEQQMALRLSENPVDTEDVVEHFVEEDQCHVELFLVKHFEARLDVGAQLLAVHWNVILRQPIGEEDRASQRLLAVDVGEVFQSYAVDVLVGPLALGVFNETILEEAQGFVRPEPHQSFDRQRLQRSDGLADTAHPACHFTRRVDVVRLHVLRESFLRHEIELDHGRCERVGEGAQRGHQTQHGAIERAVNLLERRLARIVDVDDGYVT